MRVKELDFKKLCDNLKVIIKFKSGNQELHNLTKSFIQYDNIIKDFLIESLIDNKYLIIREI